MPVPTCCSRILAAWRRAGSPESGALSCSPGMDFGPHGEQVDVRRPGTYEEWHERAGLTCIVCAAHVHVYRPRSGTLWIRHRSQDEQRCAAFASGPEGYEHSLLKYWVRDRLRVNGYDAECERQAGAAIPDVRTVGTTRRLAVEVQLVQTPPHGPQAPRRRVRQRLTASSTRSTLRGCCPRMSGSVALPTPDVRISAGSRCVPLRTVPPGGVPLPAGGWAFPGRRRRDAYSRRGRCCPVTGQDRAGAA